MTLFLARANVLHMVVGQTGELDDANPDVAACEQMNLIVRANPDGTFPDPQPIEPLRCCGR